MDLWQLHTFTKVIELKSFSKAGSAVHLSQPTVSGHIKDLENYFECQLIDRLGKEALPTKAGKLLYGYAKKLLSLKNEMETSLTQFKGKTKGHLTVGGSTIPGEYILPQIIASFMKKYPGVTVDLEIDDSEKIVKAILEGDIEIGLVGASYNNQQLVQEQVIKDSMCLIINPEHHWKDRQSVTIEMLADEPFISREPGSGTLKSLNASFHNAGVNSGFLKTVTTMGSTTAVKQGVKNGIGTAVLSRLAVEDDLKNGSILALSIDGLELSRFFYLTVHKSRAMSPLCSSFADFIKKMEKH